jgi:hypothetical protein
MSKMQFLSLLVVLAITTCSIAQDPTDAFDPFGTPDTDGEIIEAGKPYKISWTPTEPFGNITILLMEGPTETTQNLGDTVVCELRIIPLLS